MDKLVEMGEHKEIFLILHTRTQQHISKKCPINGQCDLTVFVNEIIQQLPDILLRIIIW